MGSKKLLPRAVMKQYLAVKRLLKRSKMRCEDTVKNDVEALGGGLH